MPTLSGEFPTEEFAGVPNWNAAAWVRIQVRDARSMQQSQLASFVARATVSSLAGMKAELSPGTDDTDLLATIVAEMERRRAGK